MTATVERVETPTQTTTESASILRTVLPVLLGLAVAWLIWTMMNAPATLTSGEIETTVEQQLTEQGYFGHTVTCPTPVAGTTMFCDLTPGIGPVTMVLGDKLQWNRVAVQVGTDAGVVWNVVP